MTNKNRFASLSAPYGLMVAAAVFGHVAATVALAAVFVAATVVICAEYLVTEFSDKERTLDG